MQRPRRELNPRQEDKKLMVSKVANLAEEAIEEQCGTPFIMFIAVNSKIGMENFKNVGCVR
jgi:hypothetical protein